MGSNGDTEFLMSSDWNAANNHDAGSVETHSAKNKLKGADGKFGEGDNESATNHAPNSTQFEHSNDYGITAVPITTTTPQSSRGTFDDVTPNKIRRPPASELTPPSSATSTPQKKFPIAPQGKNLQSSVLQKVLIT
jgi:hypothetical protein